MTILTRTPLFLIMLVMMILSGYALYKGLEVFFRFAELMVSGVLMGYFLLMFMSFISGDLHWSNLLPVLEDGVNPIIKEGLETATWFPFGQMMIFLVFWSYLNEKKERSKTSIRAYLVSAAVILVMSFINLGVLGPEYAGISTVPLLQTVQMLQIANVFERFDAVVILLFYSGILIKATLWYLAAVVGLGQLFRTDYRKFILPVGGIIFGTSFLPENWQSHIMVAKIVAIRFLGNPIIILTIPLLLYIAMLIKGKSNRLSV
jgi:spore germination protein KB